MDARDRLTAVLVTCAGPTRLAAKRALEQQTLGHTSAIVANVTPMDRAFQAMIDAVATPYFVQVDEDMILHPDALQRMLAVMEHADVRTWQIAFPLFDSHLQRLILGCKIYRTDVARQYPYRSSPSCEVDQYRRAEKDGYAVIRMPLTDDWVVGSHEVPPDPRVTFERYLRLARKCRARGTRWLGDIPRQMLARDPMSQQDALALAGWCVGWLTNGQPTERDHRHPDPEWSLLAPYLDGIEPKRRTVRGG